MIDIIWPSGKYYDCADSETLSCTDPEEAVAEYLESIMTLNCDVATLIRETGEITVTAYDPDVVTEAWLLARARRAVADFEEAFDEDYMSSGDDGIEFSEEKRSDALEAILAALQTLVAEAHVYNCHETGSVTLSPEQVEALMRECNPDWFEEEK